MGCHPGLVHRISSRYIHIPYTISILAHCNPPNPFVALSWLAAELYVVFFPVLRQLANPEEYITSIIQRSTSTMIFPPTSFLSILSVLWKLVNICAYVFAQELSHRAPTFPPPPLHTNLPKKPTSLTPIRIPLHFISPLLEVVGIYDLPPPSPMVAARWQNISGFAQVERIRKLTCR